MDQGIHAAVRKDQVEFLELEYFYAGLEKLDSEGVQVFSKITDCLKKDFVKLKELIQFIQSRRSIPEIARGVIWRVLLNYLPENRKQWLQIIDNNAKHYAQLIDEYILSGNRKTKQDIGAERSPKVELSPRKQKEGECMSNNNMNNVGVDASKNDNNIAGNKIISKTGGTSEASVQPPPPQPKSSNSTDLFANAPVITVPRNRLLGQPKNSSYSNSNTSEKYNSTATSNSSSSSAGTQSDGNNGTSSQESTSFNSQDIGVDHPLNRKQSSSWHSHFKDLEIWEMIEKDTKRTRAEFYSQKLPQPKLFGGQIAKLIRKQQPNSSLFSQQQQQSASLTNPSAVASYRYDALTRILFIYYKITSEDSNVRYVQGMNEVAGLIYQCFSSDNSSYLSANAESDAFYCFCIVMTKIKPMFDFSRKSQNTSGTNPLESHKPYVDAFIDLFKKADLQLFNHFASLSVDPKLICLNWMIGFFCQNFEAAKAMQVWDCLLLAEDIIQFLPYVCVAILYVTREELFMKEPSQIILKLQNINDLNLDKVTKMAFNLYNEFGNK